MVGVFTIAEINYLMVSPFWDLVRPLLHFMFAAVSSLATLQQQFKIVDFAG